MSLSLQVHAILPIVPVLYPLIWRILSIYGQARVFSAFQTVKHSKVFTLFYDRIKEVCLFVCLFVMFNATFNNITVISWQ
jgi:hypothetical protein